jgi:hypothetical protein
MKINDNFMNDLLVILTYEFLKFTHHIWYNLLLIIFHMILLKFKRYFYIPIDKNLNLQKILLVYNNNIILYNLINLNYYHINTTINDKKIKMIGNNNFIIINHTFLKINNYDKILRTSDGNIVMYKLPLKIYDKSECCVCLENEGTLIGVCGHQNICSECISRLTKCPMCNNHILFNKLNSQIINYLQLT